MITDLVDEWVSHPTRTVRLGTQVEVEIDVDIVDLIQSLWRMGFPTLFSCQGGPPHGDTAYVLFAHWEAAGRVAELVGLPTVEAKGYVWRVPEGTLVVEHPSEDDLRSVLRWDPATTALFTECALELP